MSTFTVTVHPFESQTPSSCAYERGISAQNALVYIGGLTGGRHSALQSTSLVEALRNTNLGYTIWEFRMRSSYTGFGYSSLANDAADIGALVSYLKTLGKEKIVLLGSSTGCQGIMTYVRRRDYPAVSAYILQAPTSDRETVSLLLPPDSLAETLQHAEDMIAKGEAMMPSRLIPSIFHSPISAYRWHSLLSDNGDDDFFSSDLPASALADTFGKLDTLTLVLPSENDEMIPPSIDKSGLLNRWKSMSNDKISDLSEVMPGADHELTGTHMQSWFTKRVIEFLQTL